MYYLEDTKRSDTASGTVLQKRCFRICGLNPRLIYHNSQGGSSLRIFSGSFLDNLE